MSNISRQEPIIICGGGLAGSACAIGLAQRGHRVTLLEKANFPRRKLCGEFLGPDAMPVLEALEVLDTVLAQMPQVKTIRLHNRTGQALTVKTSWIRRDYPYAVAASRAVLDILLLEHAKAWGVNVQENNRVVRYEVDTYTGKDELFRVEVEECGFDSQPPTHHAYETRWLIDAGGRNSQLATIANRLPSNAQKASSPANPTKGSTKIEKGVGMQCHIRLASKQTDLSMFFFNEGYGGIQPISAEYANLCVWVNPKAAQTCQQDSKKLIDLLRGNPAANRLLRETAFDDNATEKLQTVGGVRQLHQMPGKQTLWRIGDAMLTVEPFSGFGMSHALQSGLLAAHAIDEARRAGLGYPHALERYTWLHRQKFATHMQVLKRVQPILHTAWLQKLCWPLLPPVLPLAAMLYR